MRKLCHSAFEEISVEGVSHGLSDPVRAEIFAHLAATECAKNCSAFSKTPDGALAKATLARRFRALREAPARSAVGIGARRGVDAEELAALVARLLAERVLSPREPGDRTDFALFSLDAKRDEAGLHEAARLLNATIYFLPLEALIARKDDVLTRSPRVEALMGVGSVAEAAALAGAGPRSILLGPRLATRTLTCAIARSMVNESP